MTDPNLTLQVARKFSPSPEQVSETTIFKGGLGLGGETSVLRTFKNRGTRLDESRMQRSRIDELRRIGFGKR
jgi:hypothetical protein